MRSQRSILRQSPVPARSDNQQTSYLDMENNDSRVAGVYKMLSETGRLEQIRAQLRREIFTHLLDTNKSANTVDIDLMTSTPGRLSLALVAGFVRHHFPATFSVFMAEANLAWLPVDDNESLLLTRLSVPIDADKKENAEAVRSSALESVVQYLLRMKLHEPSKGEGESDKAKPLAASWQPFSEKKQQIPVENVSEALTTKSAETILSEMRALIREELAPMQPQKDIQPQTEQLQQRQPVAPNVLPQTSAAISGLDESRLQEYIEKMVERMMGPRRSEIDNKTDKAEQAVHEKQPKEGKSAKKKHKEAKVVAEKKGASPKPKSQNKKQLSFHEPVSPSKKQSPGKSAARQVLAAGSTSISTILTLEEIRRQFSTSPEKPAGLEPAGISSGSAGRDGIEDVFEVRQRLNSLEREAEKLESICNQRLASLDVAQPLASTFNLIDRLNSNRPAFTGRATTAPASYSVGALRPAASLNLVQPVRLSTSNYRSSSYGGVGGSSCSSTGLNSAARRMSPPIRSSIGTTLPASSKVLAMMNPSVVAMKTDPYNSKEYNQSQNLLTSVPTADYRWAANRHEASMLSTSVQRPSVTSPPLPPAPPPPQIPDQLPFSVFPSGFNVQQEVQQALQQMLSTSPPAGRSSGRLMRQNRRDDDYEDDYEDEKKKSDEREHRPKNKQPRSSEVETELKTDTARLPAEDFQQKHEVRQHSRLSSEEAKQTTPKPSKFLSPTVLEKQDSNEVKVQATRSILRVETTPPPIEQRVLPPVYSLPDASPEMNKIEDYLPHTVVYHREEDVKPQEEDKEEQPIVEATDVRHEETSPVAAVVPEEPAVEAPKAAGGADEVDDVLKKYMEMVLQKRAVSAGADSSPKAGASPNIAKYDYRNYENDDEDEDKSPTLFADRNRPKVVSKGRQDDPPSTSDDFWS